MANEGNGYDVGSGNISLVNINKEMRRSYLQYSMSVIVGRALPDVRDGLKPVHRRILFAMKELGNVHNKPFKKSARIVGDVIGKYHPHGEAAVYDAIVRMAQDFSMQEILIDGQGNFGSIDGDNAAASRYTEIRMTALAEELLKDLEKETVSFQPNYDDTLLIPQVLPSRFPNLLVNGSAGIAVGMSCNIPPHNLKEVIDGCLYFLENPDCSIDDLIQKIPGPDFPTAGIIEGRSAIVSAYKTGKGIITINSVTEIIENDKKPSQILIHQLPYQVNKARLTESIAELVKDKKIEGISDIRDESSREGLRVLIQVKRDADPKAILHQLQKQTQLRTSFGIIFLALDKRNRPKVFNLKEMIQVFIEHRKNIITKRIVFDLKKAQEKLHILEGLKKALESIDEVIALIKNSKESAQARRDLVLKLDFSQRQAQAVLEMRLQKLTGLEREKIEKEKNEIKEFVKNLKEILASEEKIEGVLKEELEAIKQSYGKERKTLIEEGSYDIQDRDLIAEEEVVVFLTYKGMTKRIPIEEYRLQRRGGKGLKGWELRTEGDFVWKVLGVNTLDRLLVFTSKGRLHWLDVYKIPTGGRQTKGRSLNNLLAFKESEEVRAVLAIKDLSKKDAYLCMITENGVIKRTSLEQFSKPRTGGVQAISIDEDDVVKDVKCGTGDFLVFTKKGQVIRFKPSDVRPSGRTSRGVRGIKLQKGDKVVSMEITNLEETGEILTVTENGFGKRVKLSQFKIQKRGGRGVLGQKITTKTGNLINACLISESTQVLMTTNQGQSIRFSLSNVSVFGRISQGVKFIDLKENEKVTGVTLIDED